jgi:hypothetical protein
VKLKLAYLEVRIGQVDDLNEKLDRMAKEATKNRDRLSPLSNAPVDIRSDAGSPRPATAERTARR